MSSANELPVVWIQGAGCSGCSVSVLNGVAPDIASVVLDELVPGQHLSLRFHPTVMAGAGELAVEVLGGLPEEKSSYVLVVEGAIPTGADGAFCEIGQRPDGEGLLFSEQVHKLAEGARAVVALGDCAAFGGIPSVSPNPTGCMGTKAFLETRGVNVPVLNVGGCPPHPDWFLGTLVQFIMSGGLRAGALDPWGRSNLFYGKLIHDSCPRRADFDTGRFAKRPGDPGCLYLLGCKGPMTYADCPDRMWNNGVTWCIGAGAPCMGCAEARFFERFGPVYKKITDDWLERFRDEE